MSRLSDGAIYSAFSKICPSVLVAKHDGTIQVLYRSNAITKINVFLLPRPDESMDIGYFHTGFQQLASEWLLSFATYCRVYKFVAMQFGYIHSLNFSGKGIDRVIQE